MSNQAYSKKQVERAGESLKQDSILIDRKKFSEVMKVLSYWRFSHEEPLETAFALLQEETSKVEKHPIYGKRLKRLSSIRSKLQRFDTMSLKTMQDIGGCRAVVTSQKKVFKIAKALKKRPEFKSGNRFQIKNYIKKPKPDGYRSLHMIGRFFDSQGDKKKIEIQLRTYIQHYWATAVEIVDIFTNQALKSNQGQESWKEFFVQASQMFSIMEDIPLFDTLDPQSRFIAFNQALLRDPSALAVCSSLKKTMKRLKVIDSLEAYANSVQIVTEKIKDGSDSGYVILVVELRDDVGEVSFQVFSPEEAQTAERKYIANEKKYAGKDNFIVAMISTDSMGEIEKAYPNYFADSSLFIALLHLIRVSDGKLGARR